MMSRLYAVGSRMFGGWAAIIMAACFAHAAVAQDAAVAAHYPSGSIRSAEAAERALADVTRARAEVEQRFTIEERTCYSKFFATSCMDDAKERRRKALAQLRAVEVEANAYKRRVRAAERYQAQSERRAREEADKLERAERQQERESSVSARTAGSEPPQKSPATASAAASARRARHDAKLKRLHEEDAADAKKRADNIVSYERKIQAAQAHQKEVESRKAEKERERLMKQNTLPAAQ